MKQRYRKAWISAVILNYLLNVTLASPVFVSQLFSGGTGRNIRHLPCVSRRTGETGVCMFAFTCAKANGTHLGTCIDRFYFGSCCKIDDEPDVFPQDNTIDDDSAHQPIKPIGPAGQQQPDSNDIPGNVDKQEVVGQSTTTDQPLIKIETEQTTLRLDEQTKTTKPHKASSTKKPIVGDLTTTTESIKLSTFQTVQNASEQPTSAVPSTTVIVPTTKKLPRPSSSHAKPTTSLRPKPSSSSYSTAATSSHSPTLSGTTEKATASLPPTSSFTGHVITSNKPFGSTVADRPLSTLDVTTRPIPTPLYETTLNTTRYDTSSSKYKPTEAPRPTSQFASTRFPPRNSTTEAATLSSSTVAHQTLTSSTSDTKVSPSTKKPSTATKKPSRTTTKKPSSPTTPTKGSPTNSTTTGQQSSFAPSSAGTSATSPLVTVSANDEKVTTAAPATLASTKRPTSAAGTSSSSKKPAASPTKKPLTTFTTKRPTHSKRPTASVTKKNTTATSFNSSKVTSIIKKPTTPTVPSNATSSAIIEGKPTATTAYTKITTTRPVSTTRTTTTAKPSVSLATTTTSPKITTQSTSTSQSLVTSSSAVSETTVKSTTQFEVTSAASLTTSQKNVTNAVTPTSQLNQTVSDAVINATTPMPGIVTWTSVSDAIDNATKTSEVYTTTSESTETAWSPITTPDGWIIIQSPSTEKPQPEVNAEVKPASSSTEAPVSSTKPASESVTSQTTQRTTTQSTTYMDTLSTLATVTVAPDFVESNLNMSSYKQVCGKRLYPESRIVGGDESNFGKWPWQISLRQWRTSTYLHKCGAALLNENWAITAAHCVQNVLPSDLLLRIGEHDLGNENEPYGFQERRVQIVASHPNFDPRTFEFDLALMRFYEPVLPFQPNVLPICIPDNDEDYVGQTAFVTGWGRLYEDGPLPSVLQEVAVPVINNSVCEGMYRNAGYIEHIPHIFICAGWRKGGFDSCEGDSGGPLVIQRKSDKRWVLAGVISWGIGCAEPNQPGVYTRISEFREWINQILQF